jgi:hypothetical protein
MMPGLTRITPAIAFASILAWTGTYLAQNTHLGIATGFGFYHDATLAGSQGTAHAGFGPRFVASVVVGHRFSNHVGVDARYTFQDGDSELRSGGVEANLDAHAHSFLGDLLMYPRVDSRLQPFAAIGFGAKIYQATELLAGPRPLANFAILVNGSQAEPLIAFGGGVKFDLLSHCLVRLDLRDYATPFPKELFSTAPGVSIHGWLHDFVPIVGISRRF